MKKCFVAALAVVLSAFLVSGASADEGKKPDWKKGCPDGFVRKSLDQDGFVELKALPKETIPQVREFLTKADEDKDGKVTKKELHVFFKKAREAWQAQAKADGKPVPPKGDWKPGKHGPRPECRCCDKCRNCPDCKCCDKCPCGKAPRGKAPWGAQFGPAPMGPANPMFFAEMMKHAYKDGFQDGFRAAMEMQHKGHGHHPGPACGPKDFKHGPKDGKGPRMEDPFKKFGNGKEIDLAKLPKDVWPRFVECLKASDKDKNGKVTREEFGEFMKARWEAKKAEKESKNKDEKK